MGLEIRPVHLQSNWCSDIHRFVTICKDIADTFPSPLEFVAEWILLQRPFTARVLTLNGYTREPTGLICTSDSHHTMTMEYLIGLWEWYKNESGLCH
jgi:hypothetical protein